MTNQTNITLNKKQQQAVDDAYDWYYHSAEQTYVLGGYAGTGKTTTVRHIIDDLAISKDRVLFACPTGIASLVLDNVLNKNSYQKEYQVKTIHGLIYKAEEDNRTNDLRFYKRKKNKKVRNAKLLVIDEAFMITRKMYADLVSFGIKILFVGDPGQLKPVTKYKRQQDLPALTEADIDIFLDKVERNAGDSIIPVLAEKARKGEPIPFGVHGNNEVVVISKQDFYHYSNQVMRESCLLNTNQIICGRNATKDQLNKEIRQLRARKEVAGGGRFKSPYPAVGDKVMCLKNNWSCEIGDSYLVNGMTGTVQTTFPGDDEEYMTIRFQADMGGGVADLDIANCKFDGSEDMYESPYKSPYDYFEFGYAITCHKAQGSEWDKVVIFNEVLNPREHQEWLYTAMTRATKQLIIVV